MQFSQILVRVVYIISEHLLVTVVEDCLLSKSPKLRKQNKKKLNTVMISLSDHALTRLV